MYFYKITVDGYSMYCTAYVTTLNWF